MKFKYINSLNDFIWNNLYISNSIIYNEIKFNKYVQHTV